MISRMLKVIALTVAMSAAMVWTANADAIKTRKGLMKWNGASMGVLVMMAKGELAFDAAKAKTALESMNLVATGYESHFPAGSDMGGETTASPKIWTDMDGFKKAAAKFAADASAAVGPASADLAGLRASLGSVGSNCKGCHEAFRVKK